ncbi:MAG: M1 family aminopeptidase, partial [Chloroflexota bacterium]
TITQAFGALLGDVLSAEELAALVPSDLETISGEDLPGLLTLAPSESIMLRPGALLDFLEIVGLTDMLDARSLPVVPGDPGPQRIFNRVVYERGALTLHALRLEVGDDAFFETLRSYAATYANGNARTPDFIAIAEQVSGQDLTDFFNAWLYQPSVPDIPQMGLFWAEAVR